MSSMKYHEYCKQHGIRTFPLRLWMEDHLDKQGCPVILADGKRKQKKNIGAECFGTPKNVYDYYGEELGKYLCEHNLTKKNWRQLHDPQFEGYNPELGLRKIMPKMTDFDMPPKLLKQYIKCKWRGYRHNNEQRYTHFAVDTHQIGVVDIDCVLPDDSPFTALLSKHPFKKSNSKSFGIHLIFNRKDIPQQRLRQPDKLPKKWGVDSSGKSGIEFLNGIWEWAKLSDEIENPDADLTPEDWLKQEIIKLISNNHRQNRNIMMSSSGGGESKTSEPDTAPPAVPVTDAAMPLPPNALENLIENINNFPAEQMAGVQNWGGIIRCWSLAKSLPEGEMVFNILHEACKRSGANYGGEEPIRENWNRPFPVCDPDYQRYAFGMPTAADPKNKGFYSWWCVKHQKDFNWTEFMDDDDKCVQERFMENHKKNFLINTDYKKKDSELCYFDETTKLWSHDKKCGIGKSIIHQLLMKQEYIYWKTEMEASIEGMDDHSIDDDGQQQPNAFKEACIKFKKKHLKKYHSTGGWLGGTIKNIYNNLIYDPSLREEVQFNLMENTKHLFQFRNGAFNLKTGQFEGRTREMYISGDAILKYDFPVETATEEEYAEEILVIKNMLKKIIPNDAERFAWCSWKGYCLTGEINGQMFFIYLGASAGNGKSTLMEIFKDAFPCYFKLIGKEAVLDKIKDDKCLSGLVNTAYRGIYTEEITQIGLKVKELTQQTTPVKPLYMEEILLQIQFKFEGLCNAVPETKCDEGVLRRARQIECNSTFVDDEDDVDEENNIYLKDATLGVKFKLDERYKIALFLYFAKYAKDYYSRGVNDWKRQFEGMREAFEETNQEDDPLAQFMKYFKREGEEDEHGDFDYHISKAKMLEYLYEHTGDEYVKVKENGVLEYKSFTKVKQEFKKKRFQKYQGSWRKSGSKGFFPNIRYTGGEDSDSD